MKTSRIKKTGSEDVLLGVYLEVFAYVKFVCPTSMRKVHTVLKKQTSTDVNIRNGNASEHPSLSTCVTYRAQNNVSAPRQLVARPLARAPLRPTTLTRCLRLPVSKGPCKGASETSQGYPPKSLWCPESLGSSRTSPVIKWSDLMASLEL